MKITQNRENKNILYLIKLKRLMIHREFQKVKGITLNKQLQCLLV